MFSNCSDISNYESQLKQFKDQCSNQEVASMQKNMYNLVQGPLQTSPRESFVARIIKQEADEIKKGNKKKNKQDFRQSIYRKPQVEQPTLPIPKELKLCDIYNNILSTDCNLSFNRQDYQREYEKISGTQSISFPNYESVLEFSILDSIVTSIVQNSGNACIGGDLELWLTQEFVTTVIEPSPAPLKKKNPRNRANAAKTVTEEIFTVLPNSTTFNLVKNIDQVCQDKSLIYFPLTIHWVTKNHEKEVEEMGQDAVCSSCNGCEDICQGSHAMAILITKDENGGSIYLHEPNSKIVYWYGPIFNYLEKLFKHVPYFKNYRMEDPGTFTESWQLNNTPQCAFYSALFIILKTSCNFLTGNEIIHSLYQYGTQTIELLLRQFTCFLLKYGNETGIIAASQQLPDVWSKILNKFNNSKYYRISAKQLENYMQQLIEIEQVARFDVVAALDLMTKLNNKII